MPSGNLDTTQYAWDPEAEQEVHIGFREDWADRINMRWTTKLREAAEIAEHSSWGRRYYCCKDPNCMILVETVQGESDRRWCFRRKDPGGNKPDRCTNRDHYVGESSWHWKTVLSIKKYFQRLLDKEKPWMGRNIVKVEREQSRVFANGEFTETLKPDVFVRFDDGEWFAIEVVYTHGPEKQHHEAYKPLEMDGNSGPRVIIINLNQEIPGTITDESHGQWAKDGGMEEALEREASLEERQRRFNERRENLHVGPHQAKTLRARRELAAQLAKDHPHLNLELPLGEYTTTEQVEQAYVEAHRHHRLRQTIRTTIQTLARKHRSDFNIDGEEMQSVEEVEAYFENALKEQARQQAAIAELRERYPKLGNAKVPSGLSGNGFDRWLQEMENSLQPRHQHLQDIIAVLREDVSLPSEVLNSYENQTVSAVSSNNLREDFTNMKTDLSLLLNRYHNQWYEHADFNEPIGEMPTEPQNQIAEWYNGAKAYLRECMVLKEAALSELPDIKKVRKVAHKVLKRADLDFDARDAKRYEAFLQEVLNRDIKSTLVANLTNSHSISFTNTPRENLDSLEEIVEWFKKAAAYRDECEQIRKEFLEIDDLTEHVRSLIKNKRIQFNRLVFNPAVFRKELEEAVRTPEPISRRIPGRVRGRRGRREEFNPFAKDASVQHRRRRDERERQIPRRPADPEPPVEKSADIKAKLEQKQREAIEKLQKSDEAEADSNNKLKSEPPSQVKPGPTREDRLAELRRKSEALKKQAPANTTDESGSQQNSEDS